MFEDFLDQFEQMKNMGSMQDIMGMIPGMDASKLGNIEIDEKPYALALTAAQRG